MLLLFAAEVGVVIGIVVSRADQASIHIAEALLEEAEWTEHDDETRLDTEGGGTYHRTAGFELRSFEALHLDLEDASAAFSDPDFLIFVSRHAGDTGPLLTAHFTGNFGPAEFGGSAGQLSPACPNALAHVLDALQKAAPPAYEVGMECTHHGPSDLTVPSMFVEIGSTETQWQDAEAARSVARAVLALEGIEPGRDRTIVGFGGGHYVPRFERIVRETDWAVGHVAADWSLDAMPRLDETVLEAAFVRSGATRAVIDGELPEVERAIQQLGFEVVSETFVRESSGLPLGLVNDLESALSPVEEGLRFGSNAPTADSYVVVKPDPSLLGDAHGVDPDRTRRAVARWAVAFETEDAGTRVSGRLALPDDGAYSQLVDELADLLGDRFERVEREDGELVARKTTFDPEKARAYGVPEGPAFGRLAAGDTLEVEGETVTPSMVSSKRVRRYRLKDPKDA